MPLALGSILPAPRFPDLQLLQLFLDTLLQKCDHARLALLHEGQCLSHGAVEGCDHLLEVIKGHLICGGDLAPILLQRWGGG